MKPLGKTIQNYCPSGEPRGVRIAEITTRIVQAVVVPRAKLDEACDREELSGVGLYFLFGDPDNTGLPIAYIGEAEDCAARFKNHNQKKEFWSIGIAVVSRTGSFTKAHAKLLEWLAIDRAKQAKRYRLDNGNSGGQPSVPEWMRSDVAEIFETAEVLLNALGFPIFEPFAGPSVPASQIFFCRRGGADARGVYTEEGFVVLKDSTTRRDPKLSTFESVDARCRELVRSGVLIELKDGYRFEQDFGFSTPSAAATVVSGGNANGWIEWRNDLGQSLDQVHRTGKDALGEE